MKQDKVIPQLPILDIDSWYRAGHGIGIDYYATDEEVHDILLQGLPILYAPYTLLTCQSIKQNQEYIQIMESHSIDAFRELRRKGGWNYYVWSRAILPEIPFTAYEYPSMACNLIGLMNIQQGMVTNGNINQSSLGLVDKVINSITNELRIHKDAVSICNKLKRIIRARLVFTAINRTKAGEITESKWPMMTEAYARKVQSGELITRAEVGRRLA